MVGGRRVPLFVVVVVLALLLPLIVAAGGRSPVADEHRRVVEFWTNERVSQASPRDFVYEPGARGFAPSKGKPPGTPGGGGGGSEEPSPEPEIVSGASWNGDSTISESTGKVLFSIGANYYVCSATVVDDGNSSGNGTAVIVTAAHCAYDETDSSDGFAANWMFVPDYDAAPASLDAEGVFCDSTALGCWTKDVIAVSDGYATAGSFNDQAVQHDFAFVRVGLGGTGGGNELDSIVEEQQISFSEVASDGSVSAYAFGYPAEKKWKGNDLIYCAGPIDGDPYNNGDTYRLAECKLNGGSSGGPWLAPFDAASGTGTVMSVNSYGYTGVNAMHGPKFTSVTRDVYQAALTRGTDYIVP